MSKLFFLLKNLVGKIFSQNFENDSCTSKFSKTKNLVDKKRIQKFWTRKTKNYQSKIGFKKKCGCKG